MVNTDDSERVFVDDGMGSVDEGVIAILLFRATLEEESNLS